MFQYVHARRSVVEQISFAVMFVFHVDSVLLFCGWPEDPRLSWNVAGDAGFVCDQTYRAVVGVLDFSAPVSTRV